MLMDMNTPYKCVINNPQKRRLQFYDSLVEVSAVQPHHDVAVPQARVVRLKLTDVLELALRHGSVVQ